jgi:hypothetical protein
VVKNKNPAKKRKNLHSTFTLVYYLAASVAHRVVVNSHCSVSIIIDVESRLRSPDLIVVSDDHIPIVESAWFEN